VLSSASLTEMTTPFPDDYGYGLEIDTEDGTLDISHNGTVDGFFAFLDYIPQTKPTVVILSNLGGEGNHTTTGTFSLDTHAMAATECRSLGSTWPTLRPRTRRFPDTRSTPS
jgi:hypothetical protein